MDDGRPRRRETFAQAMFGILVHQEADRAPVHAVDWLRRVHRAVKGLQHQAVAAQRHDDVGVRQRAVTIEINQRLQRFVGFPGARRQKGDRPGSDSVPRD